MAQSTDDVVYSGVIGSEWPEYLNDGITEYSSIPKKMTINYSSLEKVSLSARKNFPTVFYSKLRDHLQNFIRKMGQW
jgi:hypothetical protein